MATERDTEGTPIPNGHTDAEVISPPVRDVPLTAEGAEAYLREMFPHGDKEFIPTVLEVLKLHSEKNHDYAHSEEDPLGNFRRVSAHMGQYFPAMHDPSVICLTYLDKQLDAILNMKGKGYEGKVEGMLSRLLDVSCYSLIAICIEKRRAKT